MVALLVYGAAATAAPRPPDVSRVDCAIHTGWACEAQLPMLPYYLSPQELDETFFIRRSVFRTISFCIVSDSGRQPCRSCPIRFSRCGCGAEHGIALPGGSGFQARGRAPAHPDQGSAYGGDHWRTGGPPLCRAALPPS